MTPPNTTHFSWTDVWTAALTQPRPETYDILLQDKDAKPTRAFLWLFVTSIILSLVTINALFNSSEFSVALNQYLTANQSLLPEGVTVTVSGITQALMLVSVCITPFAAFVNVLLYILLGIIIHEVARRVVGPHVQEKRDALFYLIGAVAAPLTLVSAFGSIIPAELGTLLGLGVLVFQTYLFVQIARTLYNVEPRQAMTIVVLPSAIFYLLPVLFLSALV